MIILTIIIILCSKEFYLVIDATKERYELQRVGQTGNSFRNVLLTVL